MVVCMNGQRVDIRRNEIRSADLPSLEKLDALLHEVKKNYLFSRGSLLQFGVFGITVTKRIEALWHSGDN
jgi:hypothetical protein